jgi:hypothetical protein
MPLPQQGTDWVLGFSSGKEAHSSPAPFRLSKRATDKVISLRETGRELLHAPGLLITLTAQRDLGLLAAEQFLLLDLVPARQLRAAFPEGGELLRQGAQLSVIGVDPVAQGTFQLAPVVFKPVQGCPVVALGCCRALQGGKLLLPRLLGSRIRISNCCSQLRFALLGSYAFRASLLQRASCTREFGPEQLCREVPLGDEKPIEDVGWSHKGLSQFGMVGVHEVAAEPVEMDLRVSTLLELIAPPGIGSQLLHR